MTNKGYGARIFEFENSQNTGTPQSKRVDSSDGTSGGATIRRFGDF